MINLTEIHIKEKKLNYSQISLKLYILLGYRIIHQLRIRRATGIIKQLVKNMGLKILIQIILILQINLHQKEKKLDQLIIAI